MRNFTISSCPASIETLPFEVVQHMNQFDSFKADRIKLKGRTNTWYKFLTFGLSYSCDGYDYVIICGMFENEYWGDLASSVVCFYDTINCKWVELFDTYDDILSALYDQEMIRSPFLQYYPLYTGEEWR